MVSMMDYEQGHWLKKNWATSQRLYSAELKKDLLGEWVVVRTWSGKSKQGRQHTQCVESYPAGIELLHAISKRRTQRGYLEV